jgi:hypothetical protein
MSRKIIAISSAFAGALMLATTVAFMLRRVNRRGVQYQMMSEVPKPRRRPTTIRRVDEPYLLRWSMIEPVLQNNPDQKERVDEALDQVYAAINGGTTREVVESWDDLFRILFPDDGQRYPLFHQFREDIARAVEFISLNPTVAQGLLWRWKVWWNHQENYLPSTHMWLGIPLIDVGLAYFEKYNLSRGQLGDHDETLVIGDMLTRARLAMASLNSSDKLDSLTEMSEYLIDHGFAAA